MQDTTSSIGEPGLMKEGDSPALEVPNARMRESPLLRDLSLMGKTQSHLQGPRSQVRSELPTMHCGLSAPLQISPIGAGSQRLAIPQPPPGPWPADVRVVAQPGLDVPEGEALSLSCHLPGGPRPLGNSTFTWFWNGRQLHSESVPTLAFSHVARGQAGVYHCRAELPTGATLSAPVMLRVLCE